MVIIRACSDQYIYIYTCACMYVVFLFFSPDLTHYGLIAGSTCFSVSGGRRLFSAESAMTTHDGWSLHFCMNLQCWKCNDNPQRMISAFLYELYRSRMESTAIFWHIHVLYSNLLISEFFAFLQWDSSNGNCNFTQCLWGC